MAIVFVGVDLAKNVFAVHWARLFAAHGHTVLLIAPKFVAPYRMSGVRGKTDAADAAAICEAVQRPAMRFVPVKSIDQQARLMVHLRAARPRNARCRPRAPARAQAPTQNTGNTVLAKLTNNVRHERRQKGAAFLTSARWRG